MPEETIKEQIETIKIGDKWYRQDSLTPGAINAIKNLDIVNGEIAKHQLQINIANLAVQKLTDFISADIDKFEEVPADDIVSAERSEQTKEPD